MILIFIVYASLRLSFPPKKIFSYDFFGYYLYLPSLVVYDDPGIKNLDWVNKINDQYKCSPTLYQVSQSAKGNWIIRFYSGMSIMFLPFFLVGHVYALASSYPADGFSAPYQWALIFSGIFYTFLGVWLIRRLLLRYLEDNVTALTMILLFIGSGFFFFTTLGSDVPHVYVFTLLALLLNLSHRWHESPKLLTAAAIGLVTGLIAICRPSGALAVLIPVFWGVYDKNSFLEKYKLLKNNLSHVAILVAGGLLGILPQILYWLVASGQLVYNAYNDPQSGLDLFNPRIGYVLFGFRKGLYVYSTMMIFATIGFYHLFKNNRKLFLPVLLFFLANVYIISCYSSLVSFGWRAFVESHAVLAIPLGYFSYSVLNQKKILKIGLLVLLFIVIILNLFKIYQLSIGVIDGSRMTKEYYLKTFFKTKVTDEDRELLLIKRSETNKDEFTNQDKYQKKSLGMIDFEDFKDKGLKDAEDSIVYSGKYSLRLDSANIFSSPIKMPYKEITSGDHAWIRVGVRIYPTRQEDMNLAMLVVCINHKGGLYKYRAFSLKDFNADAKPGQWNLLTFDYLTPEVRSTSDKLEVYVWYRGKSPCYIDDMTVDAFVK
jgi:hypothetical protein